MSVCLFVFICFSFRGGGGGGGGEDEGAGVKVKEAVVKSLDKSRAAIEDSAKSAAEFVDMTVNKLKTTLSQNDHQAELWIIYYSINLLL